MLKKTAQILFFGVSLALFLSGCSTSKVKALQSIEVGMLKADVLDRTGSPTRISRVLSQDRWTYENESADEAVTASTYIFFAEGRVTHIEKAPSPLVPKQSAQPSSAGRFKPVGE